MAMAKTKAVETGQWARIPRAVPVNAGSGPTAILPVGGVASLVAIPATADERANMLIALGDEMFSREGFRRFLTNAMIGFDAVARQTYMELQAQRSATGAEVARVRATVGRRRRRNVRQAMEQARTLTEENAPHVVAAMLARAHHAANPGEDTGLIPVVV